MRKLIRSVGVFLFMVGITAHAQTITPQAEQRAKDIVTKMGSLTYKSIFDFL